MDQNKCLVRSFGDVFGIVWFLQRIDLAKHTCRGDCGKLGGTLLSVMMADQTTNCPSVIGVLKLPILLQECFVFLIFQFFQFIEVFILESILVCFLASLE